MYDGLGFVDPVTAATAFDTAMNFASSLFPSIGAGRKEADVIVPVSNAITARLDTIHNNKDGASLEQLQAWHAEIQRMEREFIDFVHDPVFVDGRASVQAINTLRPFMTGLNEKGQVVDIHPEFGVAVNGGMLAEIEREIYERGGPVPYRPPQLTQGPGGVYLDSPQPSGAIPQAGWIPPNLLPSYQSITGQQLPNDVPIMTAGIGAIDPLTLGVLGVAAYALLRGRR